MKRNISLEEISDGRLYDKNDMVRAGCGDCKGCSACCHGMGETIILDPYDLWRLTVNLGMTANELLQEKLELHVVAFIPKTIDKSDKLNSVFLIVTFRRLLSCGVWTISTSRRSPPRCCHSSVPLPAGIKFLRI